MKTLRPYCELIRLPNTFTALADVLAGYWLVSRELRWSTQLTCLLIASAALYSAGIVLNDLADIETDRRERPKRPLPSGRVGRRRAIVLAVVLCLAGVTAAAVAGCVGEDGPGIVSLQNRPLLVAVGLVLAVLGYDFLVKSTLLGPVIMGVCRGLNLLLGMSVGWWFSSDLHGLAIAAMFVYVASFTYFGRDEAGRSGRGRLATGGLGVLCSLLMLGIFAAWNASADSLTAVVWLALLIHLGRILLRAIRNPAPSLVRYAMKTYILGIIAFDATLATAACGWSAGAVVLAMLVPSIVLGKWLYST